MDISYYNLNVLNSVALDELQTVHYTLISLKKKKNTYFKYPMPQYLMPNLATSIFVAVKIAVLKTKCSEINQIINFRNSFYFLFSSC